MAQRTWLITGVSSGFGRQLTEQLLERGDRVVGTVRDPTAVADLIETAIPTLLHGRGARRDRHRGAPRRRRPHLRRLGRIDVVISNAGYGLFGAAEELTDEQVEHIIATNLIGLDPADPRRAAAPAAQGGGRIIQLS